MVSAQSFVGKLSRAALDLVFPPRCAGCGRDGEFLCSACSGSLTVALAPRCPCCWRPGPQARLCLPCQAHPPAFDGLRSAFVYDAAARQLVHALKYRGTTALAAPMASLLAEAVRRHDLDADVIVPVPLSGLRQRTRGYNQAAALAVALGRRLDTPVLPKALKRRRHTPAQARSADAEARRRNVVGAFALRQPEIAGLRVLLLDDVTTTGATLEACAAVLKLGGARFVWAFAFARED